MSQIKCTDLALGYENNIIIDNINFTVSNGDYLCIVGENGSGKSTLIKTLLRLIKPISGEITFDKDESSLKIGYLPQQTDIQPDFPASVREVVLSGCNTSGAHHFLSNSKSNIAELNMNRLGISGIAKKSFNQLSGGQKQRVFLARALCCMADILLLDEPASGLDPKAASEMYKIIYNLNKESNMTIIMVSHDIPASVKFASHILHIGNKSIFFGTTDEYLKSPVGRAFSSAGGVSNA